MVRYLKQYFIHFDLQSVLRRTVADYAAADQQPSGKQLELRLVQCQEEIKTPQILYFAKRYP